jgi:hypothetical protein
MQRILTVKQLKAFIDKVPGDAIVVLRQELIGYQLAKVTPEMAVFYDDGSIVPLDELDDGEGKKKLVLVVE